MSLWEDLPNSKQILSSSMREALWDWSTWFTHFTYLRLSFLRKLSGCRKRGSIGNFFNTLEASKLSWTTNLQTPIQRFDRALVLAASFTVRKYRIWTRISCGSRLIWSSGDCSILAHYSEKEKKKKTKVPSTIKHIFTADCQTKATETSRLIALTFAGGKSESPITIFVLCIMNAFAQLNRNCSSNFKNLNLWELIN